MGGAGRGRQRSGQNGSGATLSAVESEVLSGEFVSALHKHCVNTESGIKPCQPALTEADRPARRSCCNLCCICSVYGTVVGAGHAGVAHRARGLSTYSWGPARSRPRPGRSHPSSSSVKEAGARQAGCSRPSGSTRLVAHQTGTLTQAIQAARIVTDLWGGCPSVICLAEALLDRFWSGV